MTFLIPSCLGFHLPLTRLGLWKTYVGDSVSGRVRYIRSVSYRDISSAKPRISGTFVETAQRGQVWYKDVVKTFHPKGSWPNLIRPVRPPTLCVRNSPTATAELRGRFLPNIPPQSCYDCYMQGRRFRPEAERVPNRKRLNRFLNTSTLGGCVDRIISTPCTRPFATTALNIKPSFVRFRSKPSILKITVNVEINYRFQMAFNVIIVTNAYCLRPYCVPDRIVSLPPVWLGFP